jgi:ATP-dependent NAD(P)H-hydrate dehydratase
MMQAVEEAKQLQLPLVVDGSALNILARHPSLLRGYHNVLFTPNMAELGRIAAGVGVELGGPIGDHWQMKVWGCALHSHIDLRACVCEGKEE